MGRLLPLGASLLLAAVLSACSSTSVRSTDFTPLNSDSSITENQLLDVGIVVFESGADEMEEDDLSFAEIRMAEARYFPQRLMETLQQSRNWGAVRVVPSTEVNTDVTIQGKILASDGETQSLKISVHDTSGKLWYTKEYVYRSSKYAYRKEKLRQIDPFQGIYNQIANDLLAYRQQLSAREVRHLRAISDMRFARDFAPDAFAQYLGQQNGRFTVERLPPDNDPILQRVRRIRERDYLYIDTLQDYYTQFSEEMSGPYRQWRKETYHEAVALRELKAQSRNRTIAGIAGVIGGILAQNSSSPAARTAGNVAIIGGGYAIKSGFDKRAEAKLHQEALLELGESLSAEIEPKVIELEDRTVTLTGTVEQQYAQWREILRDMYRREVGL